MAGVSSNWRIASFRPANDPLGNLVRALFDVYFAPSGINATAPSVPIESGITLDERRNAFVALAEDDPAEFLHQFWSDARKDAQRESVARSGSIGGTVPSATDC